MTSALLFNIVIVTYFAAALVYAFTASSKRPSAALAGRAILIIGLLVHTVVIAQRWWLAGRPPLSNMFETLVFLGWCIMLGYLIAELKYGFRILGAAASLGALLTLAYATMVFPDTIKPLPAALKNSFWLTIHVSFCLVGYGGLFAAYITALLSLLKRTDRHRYAAAYVTSLTVAGIVGGLVTAYLYRRGVVDLSLTPGTVLSFLAGGLLAGALLTPAALPLARRMEGSSSRGDADTLDRVLTNAVSLGFLFLTIGLFTGSVWARQAWGRYWGWDPKEAWTLVAWLIYYISIHVRVTSRTRGPAIAWLAVLGFWAVLFTYFGVNFLLVGLHSYA